ncbi:MAG: secretion protein HlyD [Gammaproteobacteria bacterium]|nr:MAG: secretion protein HlyD [Gammaproteobacteria bacterium]
MKKIMLGLGAIVLSIVIVVIWWHFFRVLPLSDGLIQANGRIEGDHYTVAGKVPGKIIKLMAREGDSVEKEQILVQLDDVQLKAKVEQAESSVVAIDAQLESANTALASLEKQVPLQIETAKSAVTRAEAMRLESKAHLEQADRDARRFQILLKEHTVAKHETEQYQLALKVAKAEYTTALAALNQMKKELAQVELGWDQIQVKKDEINGLKAQCEYARAVLKEVKSVLNDLAIHAPTSGIITTRIVDVGEVVAAGSPLFDIVDLDRLYLKVYVPEKQIGKVRLGLPARIYSDAFPDKPFSATVRYIASRAEFTPKEVQTPDERVKLVYAVKLYLTENPDHRLTPGLPADAVIRWKEGVEWEKPRW